LRWLATYGAVNGAVWLILGLLDLLVAAHRDVFFGCGALTLAVSLLALAAGCWWGVRRRQRFSQCEDLPRLQNGAILAAGRFPMVAGDELLTPALKPEY
jgi:hypothetical protein